MNNLANVIREVRPDFQSHVEKFCNNIDLSNLQKGIVRKCIGEEIYNSLVSPKHPLYSVSMDALSSVSMDYMVEAYNFGLFTEEGARKHITNLLLFSETEKAEQMLPEAMKCLKAINPMFRGFELGFISYVATLPVSKSLSQSAKRGLQFSSIHDRLVSSDEYRSAVKLYPDFSIDAAKHLSRIEDDCKKLESFLIQF